MDIFVIEDFQFPLNDLAKGGKVFAVEGAQMWVGDDNFCVLHNVLCSSQRPGDVQRRQSNSCKSYGESFVGDRHDRVA